MRKKGREKLRAGDKEIEKQTDTESGGSLQKKKENRERERTNFFYAYKISDFLSSLNR